ncbi:MAG: ABC transporter permease [Thermoplasmata archaeon]|nr:ABC transporter permease [Thermoplasmata archaeon]
MRYAWDAVRRRPGRSLATALGIGLATGLVVMLLAISAGIQSSATRLAAASGIDLLATSANTSLDAGTFPPVTSAHLVEGRMQSADPNVATASPWLIASLVYANSSLYAASNASPSGASLPAGWTPTGAGSVGWIPGANAGLETPTPVRGSGFISAGDPLYANGSYTGAPTHETELDQALASILHVGVGDIVYASARSVPGPSDLGGWFANASPLRVVAITEPFFLVPSALLGFLYLSELQEMAGGASASTDFASLVLIHLTDRTDPSGDQGRLAAALPQLSIFTIGNILSTVQSAVDLYRTFGTLVGAIGVVVATLFATTILLMSVDDRSREIALLRAVGFSRARIGAFVLEEGLLLSMGGLAIGLVIGGVGAFELNRFLEQLVPGLPDGFTFVSFDWAVVASAIAEVLAIGFLASGSPALRAMSFPVAQELRAP